MIRPLLVAVCSLVLASCIVRNLVGGRRLTGTCQGACDHYIECKPGHLAKDRARCEAECPQVFSDRDSLMAYENMSCQNAIEFVDGDRARAATTR